MGGGDFRAMTNIRGPDWGQTPKHILICFPKIFSQRIERKSQEVHNTYEHWLSRDRHLKICWVTMNPPPVRNRETRS